MPTKTALRRQHSTFLHGSLKPLHDEGQSRQSRRGMIKTYGNLCIFLRTSFTAMPAISSFKGMLDHVSMPLNTVSHKPKRSVCQIPLFGPPCVSSYVAYSAAACSFAINAHNCYSISLQTFTKTLSLQNKMVGTRASTHTA